MKVVAVATSSAAKLATNDFVRDKLTAVTHGHLSIGGEIIAGGVAGAANAVLSSPLELVKLRLQCAGQYSFYTVQSGTTMWKELGGFHNITKGCGATILRDIPFGMVYFPTYNSLKAFLTDHTGYNTPLSIFLAGALAGTVASSLVTPLDMIKTRLQVLPRPGQTGYFGIMDTVTKIYREEGWRAFWKGGVARKMRAAQFGLTLFTYEVVQRLLYVDFGGSRPSGSQRETTKGVASLQQSRSNDHIGGYAVASPIFAGIESKFGLRFPKYREGLI